MRKTAAQGAHRGANIGLTVAAAHLARIWQTYDTSVTYHITFFARCKQFSPAFLICQAFPA